MVELVKLGQCVGNGIATDLEYTTIYRWEVLMSVRAKAN